MLHDEVAAFEQALTHDLQEGPVLGIYSHGLFKAPAIVQALFGHAGLVRDAVFDRFAKVVNDQMGANLQRLMHDVLASTTTGWGAQLCLQLGVTWQGHDLTGQHLSQLYVKRKVSYAHYFGCQPQGRRR
jgi:hypothetical protein